MKTTHGRLLTIVLAGLIFRLFLLLYIQDPGLNDPLHYYNLGRRLANGHGFTIDYIWHYSRLPQDLVHPIDHWMPMAGLASAMGIRLAGENPRAALIVFLLAGAMLPGLVFVATKQLNQPDSTALIAASFSALLPDFVWNSLRTDTTIINMVLVCAALLLLNSALRSKHKASFLLCGFAAGLAYLTRNDSLLILPVLAAGSFIYIRRSSQRSSAREATIGVFIVLLTFILTVAPWLIRNLHETGSLGSAETSRMFFMVEHYDHYAYGLPITLESMFERHTLIELASKRIFELLAAVKQAMISLDLPLVVLVPISLIWLLKERERDRLLQLAPALFWLLAIVIAYPILLPLKSQAGSFEKAYLTILPLFIPLGAMTIERVLHGRVVKWSFVAASLLWLALSGVHKIQQETANAGPLLRQYRRIA